MILEGTLINTAAIVVGGLLGMALGRFLNEKMQNILLSANGICVLFMGMSSALSGMAQNDDTTMLIISFALGSVVGQVLDIEGQLEKFGEWLKEKTGSQSDSRFMQGFITASLTVCIGAMAVVGSIQDGIYHDSSTLIAKALLDFIIIMVMASSMGKGCIFSAVPVFLLQGSITLLAGLISGVMSDAALLNLSITGNILIFCVGLNLLWPNKIKVANMLPTLIFAIAFAWI
jgi:uncharacterized membrane protein YqgA involved in biofilm formation